MSNTKFPNCQKHKVEKFSVLTEGCALLQDDNCVVDVTTRTPSNLQLLTEVLEAFNIKVPQKEKKFGI
jgi:hypothetical protein